MTEPAATADRHPRRWLALAVVALGVLMVVVDTTVINTALPAIQRDISGTGTSLADLQWVINAYLLPFGVLLLTAGRFADLFGRRLLLLIGLLIFVAASIACGLAQGLGSLSAFRAVQGVGAAIITPASLSLIAAIFPPQERGFAIGIWAAVIGAGGAIGPLLGGFLAEEVDWRWIFYINIPIGIVAVAGTLAWVPESRDPSLDRRLDAAGVVVSALALFGLIFGLLKGNDFGWTDPRTLALLGGAVVGMVAFVLIERSADSPMIAPHLFRSTAFAGANACALLAGFVLYGLLLFSSLFMQNILGWSAIQAGAALMPMTVMIMIGSPLAGRVTDRFGPRLPLSVGMALLALALVPLVPLDFDSGYASLLTAFAVAGAGFALVLSPLSAAALAGVPLRQAGVAAASVNAMRQLGGSIGLAILGVIEAEVTSAALLEGKTTPAGFVDSFGIIMIVCAGVAVAGAVVASLTVAPRAAAEPVPELPSASQIQVQREWNSWVATPTVMRPIPDAPPPGAPAAGGPLAELEVVSGPAQGERIELDRESLVLGRAESGVQNLRQDHELSRRHARLSWADGRLWVQDLGSTNGTKLDGQPIEDPRAAQPGASVSLGSSVLRVLSVAPAGAGEDGQLGFEVESGALAGERLTLGPDGLILGRVEAGLAALGGDAQLSRRHASVAPLDRNRLIVEDLSSGNGTFVNEHRIGAPTLVGRGDTVRVGTTTLRVVDASSRPPAAAPRVPDRAGRP